MLPKNLEDAKRNYKKLSEPKTCSIELYTKIWVRQEAEKDLATKNLQKISTVNPPPEFKAQVDYFSIIPYERHGELRKKLYDSPPDKREEVWKSFKLPLEEIEKRFIEVIIWRNEFAKNKGYTSYIEMILNKDRIPYDNYKTLVKNADKIINYCNQQLPKMDKLPTWFYSKFNLPCFMCQMSFFPFKTLDEVFGYVAKRHAILNKFNKKIIIKLDDNSRMFYKKETDSFEITINKNQNIRHQSVELIHELAHVVSYLYNFKKGTDPLAGGVHLREKEALGIELAILQEISLTLYQAHFAEALLVLQRVLFEVELYTNPKQDLSRLYADTFNRCFKKANQKDNPLYILDERIVLRPLSTLPHAVAYATYLNLKRQKNK